MREVELRMNENENKINQQNRSVQVANQPFNSNAIGESINTIENVNQLNSFKPKKKINILIIIVTIVSILVIVACILIFTNKSGNGSILSKNHTVTVDEISEYDIELGTIWINLPLGITYNLPKIDWDADGGRSHVFCYIHGCEYYNGYTIYVDKSVEGHTDLKTLASDIIAEQTSEKYKNVYGFGGITAKKQFTTTLTENVQIGNIKALYFEGESVDSSNGSDEKQGLMMIGYSFEYNQEYISVYGELSYVNEVKEEDKNEYLHLMQYIISSIKKYNGESLNELGGKVNGLYGEHYISNDNCKYDEQNNCISYMCEESEEELKKCEEGIFRLDFVSSHILNGIMSNPFRDKNVIKIDPNNVEWDGSLDGILVSTEKQKINNNFNGNSEKYYPAYYYDFPWIHHSSNDNEWECNNTMQILKEENIKIDDINMKKYIIKYGSYEPKYYVMAYTFIFNGEPYIAQFSLDRHVFDIENMTEEQEETIIKQIEVVGDSYIRTFRVIGKEN